MLGMRYAKPSPDLTDIGIYRKDVLREILQNVGEPCFKLICLLDVATMADQFNASAQFSHRHYGQVHLGIGRDDLAKKSAHTVISFISLA